MAFWRLPVPLLLKATKPELAPIQGDTLGAHLRRRRWELGLRRVDAARELGTCWKSLMWWERDEREPSIGFYPAIIEFLGYEPWPKPEALGEALKAERKRRGLDIGAAATLVGLDEGTWGRCERSEHQPSRRTVLALGRFLGAECSAVVLDRP